MTDRKTWQYRQAISKHETAGSSSLPAFQLKQNHPGSASGRERGERSAAQGWAPRQPHASSRRALGDHPARARSCRRPPVLGHASPVPSPRRCAPGSPRPTGPRRRGTVRFFRRIRASDWAEKTPPRKNTPKTCPRRGARLRLHVLGSASPRPPEPLAAAGRSLALALPHRPPPGCPGAARRSLPGAGGQPSPGARGAPGQPPCLTARGRGAGGERGLSAPSGFKKAAWNWSCVRRAQEADPALDPVEFFLLGD